MDSEQIKKGLTNEPFFDINGQSHQDSKRSLEPDPDHRKLKGQVIAQPSDQGVLQPAEYPVDPWDHESASIEQQFFSDTCALVTASISDKMELKKILSDLFKLAHELMTCYNQRIQSLLMDDRLLYRQSSEISALMIRGLMPPLEAIKALEKSLTSTRKKAVEESIEQLQKSASAELDNVEKVLKEAKSRISKYTRPLKPEQLIQKQLDQRLAQEAAELQQQIQKAPVMPLNGTIDTSNEITPSPSSIKAASPQETRNKSQKKERSAEDLTSKQLKALVTKLDNTSPEARKRACQTLLNYVETEYQYYAPLRPFLSVAGQKCELLSMNPDKVCKACQDAIQLLEDASTLLNETLSNDRSLDTLTQIDQAINKLAAFDKKLPGEVWQLLTELTPHGADSRYHLLNLLCRKLLRDGPTPLTQKAVLNKFKNIEKYLFLFNETETTGDEVFDQQFLAIYGHVFTSPSHLKKVLNTVNKPHELNALLQIFHRVTKKEEALLSIAVEKLKAMGDEQPLECILSGTTAYEFLIKALPEKASAEISHFCLSEPGSTLKQLTQSLLAKFTDYYKALELAKKQSEGINKPFSHNVYPNNNTTQLIKELSEILIEAELPDNGRLLEPSNKSSLLRIIYEDLQAIINQPQTTSQTMDSLVKCRENIIIALQNKRLTNNLASTVIQRFLQIQNRVEAPLNSKTIAKTALETRLQAPEELTQTLATLENSASPKWYNQLFTGQLQEQRVNTLETVQSLLTACQQITATPKQIASFIEAVILEIKKDNEDPLIKQLGSEMEAYANQLKK